MANISSAADVQFSPATCHENWDIDHVIFQPGSNLANLTGIFHGAQKSVNETGGPFQASNGFTTSGNWDLVNNSKLIYPVYLSSSGPTPDSPVATPFAPGAYTVAVADEWGQAVVLHFVVKATGSTVTQTTSA